jgi:prepilin-type N-terminal cleavage/methylation domain-containing protein
MKRRAQSGMTLLEVLIAVTLLSVLSIAMLMAMRVGLDALHKSNTKLMDNRRVAGAQRVLEQQIAGFMPVKTHCSQGPGSPPTEIAFFEGQPQAMRLVSSYSLQEAWRGEPRILEYQVIPGDQGRGVRLIVNEIPYSGPISAGESCVGMALDPMLGIAVPQFRPIAVGPWSFVLADKLAWCRFAYLEPPVRPPELEHWRPDWVRPRWPLAIRIEMTPLEDNPARLRPLTVTAPIRTNLSPLVIYADL